MTGKFKTVISDRGFAFLSPDDGTGDVFCHIKSCDSSIHFGDNLIGLSAVFDVQDSERRPGSREALRVRLK